MIPGVELDNNKGNKRHVKLRIKIKSRIF